MFPPRSTWYLAEPASRRRGVRLLASRTRRPPVDHRDGGQIHGTRAAPGRAAATPGQARADSQRGSRTLTPGAWRASNTTVMAWSFRTLARSHGRWLVRRRRPPYLVLRPQPRPGALGRDAARRLLEIAQWRRAGGSPARSAASPPLSQLPSRSTWGGCAHIGWSSAGVLRGWPKVSEDSGNQLVFHRDFKRDAGPKMCRRFRFGDPLLEDDSGRYAEPQGAST